MRCDHCKRRGDLERMPCCGARICWDFCLYKKPRRCPKCGADIRVVAKEAETKAAYVRLVHRKGDTETQTIKLQKRHPALIVLTSLLAGVPVNIGGREYALSADDYSLVQVVGDRNVVVFGVDLGPFIKLCESMTQTEITAAVFRKVTTEWKGSKR